MLSVIHRQQKSTPLSAVAGALPAALSAIPRRHKSTPLSARVGALPVIPRTNGNDHPRAVAVASAIAGLAVGTAAGAVLFTRDQGEDQVPAATEE
jgi:hypothetical protein